MRRVSVLRSSLRLAVASAFLLCVYLGGRIAALATSDPDLESAATAPVAAAGLDSASEPVSSAEGRRDERPRRRHGEARAVVERNMFCSSCEDSPVVEKPETFPVRLVATHVAREPRRSIAAIEDLDERLRWYARGELVPSVGIVDTVGDGWVDVEREGVLVRVTFAAPEGEIAGPTARPGQEDRGVRALSDTRYEVDRSFVDGIRENPATVRGVRVVPVKNGGRGGMRFTYVSKSSVAASLGIRSGDIVTAVNGIALDSLDATVTAYGKLADETRFSVAIMRGGQPLELDYRIVD